MALSDFFANLFGGSPQAGQPDALPETLEALVSELIEMVVETVEPRLRFLPDYKKRLEGPVRRTIAHMRSLAGHIPAPLPLSVSTWGSNSQINAFFVSAQDITTTLGRSKELRAFFEDTHNGGADYAVAALGMLVRERNILGMAIESGMLRQDVAQTTVSFTDHRIVMPGNSEMEMRIELGKRIFRFMLQIALGKIRALQELGQDLEERKAKLATQLRLLQGRQTSLESLAEEVGSHDAEIIKLQQSLSQTESELNENKAGSSTLEHYIDQVAHILDHPAEHLRLQVIPLRVTRTGIKVETETTDPVNELMLTEISVGDNLTRIIVPVICARADMPARENLLDLAARSL